MPSSMVIITAIGYSAGIPVSRLLSTISTKPHTPPHKDSLSHWRTIRTAILRLPPKWFILNNATYLKTKMMQKMIMFSASFFV